MKGITVLYEDEKVLVLDKPAGLPVQGGTGIKVSLDSLLAEMYNNTHDTLHPPQRPLLVHRLDKDTSGVIVTAKSRESAALCSALFASPLLQKRYMALCARKSNATGTIDEALVVKGRTVTAQTRYTRLWYADFPPEHPAAGPVSLLELKPATGRMHQIRRHLGQIQLPILGDDKYGNFSLNKRLKKTLGLKKLLLHAASIYLPDSLVKGGIEICAPLPDYFTSFLEILGLDENTLCTSAAR